MAYEDDPYRDEDGEPLMDPDDVESDAEPDVEADEDDDWRRERSPTPPAQDWDSLKTGKPRKRLVKKTNTHEISPQPGFDLDEDDDDDFEKVEASSSSHKKRRKPSSPTPNKDKRHKFNSKSGKRRSTEAADDPEMKEMWDNIAGGGDSEDDKDVPRTLDDDNFIDDTGVDPADRYASDNEPAFARDAPQAEEGEDDDEINQLFKSKKKKKGEKSAAEIAMLVEGLMATLEVTAEEDAELNRQSRPAVNKLKKLPLLTQVLSKKQLQLEFLDHGILGVLKNWLEPLPDGSLPNISIRTAILKILTDFPIDLEQYDRKEQLKKSGLGKVIMFLSRSDEETTGNKKLAKDLVDKWSRPIFNKSTRFEDMRSADEERVLYRRPPSKMPATKARMESRDDELEFSQGRRTVQPSERQHASRPEALSMDFVVRPQSKIDPDEIRARARQVVQDQRRTKMNKKLQQLKAPKKKQLQATKLSVEGRGMVKFF